MEIRSLFWKSLKRIGDLFSKKNQKIRKSQNLFLKLLENLQFFCFQFWIQNYFQNSKEEKENLRKFVYWKVIFKKKKKEKKGRRFGFVKRRSKIQIPFKGKSNSNSFVFKNSKFQKRNKNYRKKDFFFLHFLNK